MEELSHVNSWTADASPTARRPARTRWSPGAPSSAWWPGAARSAARPYAFTQLRSTYRHEARLGDRLPDVQRPGRDGHRRRVPDRGASNIEYAFNWFYVNSTETAYFNSGLQPGARRRRRTRTCRWPAAYEWQAFDPAANTAAYAPAAAAPAVGQPGLLRQLEQQAGARLRRGRRQLQLRLGAPRRPARRAGAGGAGGRAEVRPGVADLGWSSGPALTDLRGVEVLDELLRVLESQPVTDAALADRASASSRPGGRPARCAWRRPAGSKVYQHADAIRIFDAWWPLLVDGAVQGRARRPTCTSRWSTRCRSTSRRPGGQQGDALDAAAARPTRRRRTRARRSSTAGGATSTRTCARCSATRSPAGSAATYCGGGAPGRLPARCCWTRCARPRPSRPRTVYPGDDALRGRRPVVRRRDRPVAAGRHHPRR